MQLPDIEAVKSADLGRIKEHAKEENPAIAIVIPARNEEGLLPIALWSIDQALIDIEQPTWVVVVDNGSHDRTEEIAEAAGVKVVSEPVPGIARARQAGLNSLPSGVEVVLSTDADSAVPVNFIHAYMKLFSEHPDVVGAYGLVKYVFESKPSAADEMNFWLLMTGSELVRKIKGTSFVNEGSGANSGYRMTTAKAVGGYSTNLRRGEDLELFIRLKQQGGIGIVDAPVATSNRRILERGLFAHFKRRLYANMHRLMNGRYPEFLR